MVAAMSMRRSTVIAGLPARRVVIVLVAAHQAAERPTAQHRDPEGDEAEYAEEPRQAFEAREGPTHQHELKCDKQCAEARQDRHEKAKEQWRPHPRENQDGERMLARFAELDLGRRWRSSLRFLVLGFVGTHGAPPTTGAR